MRDGFEWDERKAAANLRKHGVSFEEATTVFEDVLALSFPDPDHSLWEDREIILGSSALGRPLLVVSVERGPVLRIISARKATPWERSAYEEGGPLEAK